MSISLVLDHVLIVLASSALSIAIGLPLGVAAYAFAKARQVILKTVDILQTIPALALLGIIMVFAGPGKGTVMIGITLYSLLPIVRNTCLGLEEVDPGIKEAARGMGMSRAYRIFVVEFPLAFPTVFTGIRIAVVNAIGTAVFAAFVGGGGLGSVITRGIRTQNMGMVLSGTAGLMGIAVVLDLLMGAFEGKMKRSHTSRRNIAIAAVVLLAALAVILPIGLRTSQSENELVLYDGDYTETQVMHHMVKILIESKTDLAVTIKDQMTQVNNFKALTSASCDLMISYDGTLLTTFLHADPDEVPDGASIYDYANTKAREQFGVYLLGKLGFDNTYAIAVPQGTAEKYGIDTISELIPYAPSLVFGAEHEFFTEEGSMKFGPFTKFYGLNFKDSVSVDVSLKYTAIESGSFDVTEVYATDGLNRKANLKVLDDDLGFFPEYNGALLVREDTFGKFANVAPELKDVLALLDGKISNEDMVELTYQVDVNERSIDEVAREFLEARGII